MRAQSPHSILAILAILTAACADTPDSGVPLAPEIALQGKAADLAVDVRYYFGISNCQNPATQDTDGDWSFPVPTAATTNLGNSACLIAQIAHPGNHPPSGFVLWEQCGTPGNVGPKADCDVTGIREWGPRTGETWRPVDASGEVVSSTFGHSCTLPTSFTRGYRYRYSPKDPTTHPAGEVLAQIFPAFDVTSTVENCSGDE